MEPLSSTSAIISSTITPTAQAVIVQIPQTNASSTDYVAWAGFLLSIVLGVFELWKYVNDKPKLKITFRFNQQIMGLDAYGRTTDVETGKTFWTVDVANTGTKNIIITSIEFSRTDTKKFSILTKDYSGPINRYTLIPGDNHSYTIGDDLIDPKKANNVFIRDATGKVFKKRIVYKE